ncbi:MAG: diguanylate cyclase [Burkholderiales bacterium]|nr:diguanylate cyclase [Burkholderiales bacterium]
MGTPALVVWSMALGAIAAVALARAGDLALRPERMQLRALAYHLGVFLLVLVESGVLRQAAHPSAERLRVLQVLAGPLCVGFANFWIRGWLAAGERDRLMAAALRASAFVLPAGGIAALALPPGLQLPASALLALAGSGLTCWLTVRAWTIGDRLALPMAAGCLLTLPAIAGLYALAMRLGSWGLAGHAAVAFAAAASNAVTGHVLWRRARRAWRTQEPGGAPALDPVTRVHSAEALVRQLVAAQKRRRRTGREGALLAVTVFAPERIAAQAGPAALDEVWMTLAARIQREAGPVNPVGRYWDRCFVALVETIPARPWLRTLGLRLAAALRQPVEVTGRDGEPVRLRVDFGVGVVLLSRRPAEVEDVLDAAQRLAEAARGLPSRAATADPRDGGAVPLEQARLEAGPPERAAAAAAVAGRAAP